MANVRAGLQERWPLQNLSKVTLKKHANTVMANVRAGLHESWSVQNKSKSDFKPYITQPNLT